MHIAHRSLSFWSHRSAVPGARSLPSLLAALIFYIFPYVLNYIIAMLSILNERTVSEESFTVRMVIPKDLSDLCVMWKVIGTESHDIWGWILQTACLTKQLCNDWVIYFLEMPLKPNNGMCTLMMKENKVNLTWRLWTSGFKRGVRVHRAPPDFRFRPQWSASWLPSPQSFLAGFQRVILRWAMPSCSAPAVWPPHSSLLCC